MGLEQVCAGAWPQVGGLVEVPEPVLWVLPVLEEVAPEELAPEDEEPAVELLLCEVLVSAALVDETPPRSVVTPGVLVCALEPVGPPSELVPEVVPEVLPELLPELVPDVPLEDLGLVDPCTFPSGGRNPASLLAEQPAPRLIKTPRTQTGRNISPFTPNTVPNLRRPIAPLSSFS